jgi:hypothetical protein
LGLRAAAEQFGPKVGIPPGLVANRARVAANHAGRGPHAEADGNHRADFAAIEIVEKSRPARIGRIRRILLGLAVFCWIVLRLWHKETPIDLCAGQWAEGAQRKPGFGQKKLAGQFICRADINNSFM